MGCLFYVYKAEHSALGVPCEALQTMYYRFFCRKIYPMDGNYLPEGMGNNYTEQGEKITRPIPENTT